MKPIKLIMNGFITYKNEEIINFENFAQDSLFIISGPTGAGKTTIFDAICFALYGKISSQDRGDGEDLRCQYLSAEDPKTFVEFVFRMQGKEIKIRRYPRQIIKKPRGKIDTVSEEVELYFDNKVITSNREANEKIIELTGLTWEQFTKIVMLPQGEFRKFLSASSDEKEIILRKIFDTGIYQTFSEEVKKRYFALQKEFSDMGKRVNYALSSLDETTLEKLSEYVRERELPFVFYDKALEILAQEGKDVFQKRLKMEEQIVQIQKNKQDLIVAIERAIEQNRRVESFEEKKSQMQALEQQSTEMENRRKKYDSAQKAFLLKATELQLNKHQQRIKNHIGLLCELEEQEQELQLSFAETEKHYHSLREVRLQIDILQKQAEQTKKDLENHLRTEEKKTEQTNLKKKIEQGIVALQKTEKHLEETEKELLSLGEPLLKLSRDSETLLDLQEKILPLAEKREKYVEIFKLLGKIKKEKESYLVEQKRHSEAQSSYEKAEKDLKEAKKEFENQLLYVYAENLTQGEPCPLCGSIHHPNVIEVQKKWSREQIEQLENKLQNYKEDTVRAAEKSNTAQRNMEEFCKQTQEIFWTLGMHETVTEHNHEKLEKACIQAGRALRMELETLDENKKQLTASLSEVKLHVQQEEKCRRKREELQKEWAEEKQALSGLQKLEEHYLIELENLEKLLQGKGAKTEVQNNLRKIEEQIKQQQDFLNKTEENYRERSKQKANLQGRKKSLTESIASEQSAYEENFTSWREQVIVSFGEEEQYRANYMSKEELESEKEFLTEFERRYQATKAELHALDKLLPSKQRSDVENLKRQRDIAEQEEKIFTEKRDVWSNRSTRISFVEKEIRYVTEKSTEQSTRRERLGRLYRLCSGENPMSATLEAYVLMYFFEEVLAHANQRLYKMTDGQYFLYRKEENFKGNRRNKGLELEILDTNVGKKRNTAMLSGGESFLVSLSLALGLSDAMMNSVGQVEINTLFIDEGFGTLDKERLQNAIDCLAELAGRNRMIGIISHVEELKTGIPNKILVQYEKNKGSSLRIVS